MESFAIDNVVQGTVKWVDGNKVSPEFSPTPNDNQCGRSGYEVKSCAVPGYHKVVVGKEDEKFHLP